jgi:Tfp pilus assembly protein PilZ
MQKLADKAAEALPPEDVLRKIRIPLIRRASLSRAGAPEDVFLIDLGLHGAFVERAEPLPVGEEVLVTFRLPDNELPVTARCRVAWWHPPGRALVSKTLPSGLGLEFLSLEDGGRERIRQFIGEYLGREPRRRRFHRQPEATLELEEEEEEP